MMSAEVRIVGTDDVRDILNGLSEQEKLKVLEEAFHSLPLDDKKKLIQKELGGMTVILSSSNITTSEIAVQIYQADSLDVSEILNALVANRRKHRED